MHGANRNRREGRLLGHLQCVGQSHHYRRLQRDCQFPDEHQRIAQSGRGYDRNRHWPHLVGQFVGLWPAGDLHRNGVAGRRDRDRTFRDGATSLGAGTLANGVAVFSTNSLGAGSHSITAVYGGDTIYDGSTSNTLSESVGLASTTSTLSSSRNPSTFGAPVGITAAVAAVAPGGGIPTGTVQFFDGAASLGTAILNSAGIASINTQNLSVGTHLISALYNGGGNYRASVSSTLTEVVNTAPTSVKLSSSAKTSVVGQRVTFTASLSATNATGTVRFMYTSGGGQMCSWARVTLAGGTASFSTSSLAIGSYPMIARYDGDANFSPSSTSSVLSQTVGQAATNTALTSSPNPASVNQQVQLTATVTVVAPGAGTPTGFVQFKVGKFNWGQPVPVNASGVASTIFFLRGLAKTVFPRSTLETTTSPAASARTSHR